MVVVPQHQLRIDSVTLACDPTLLMHKIPQLHCNTLITELRGRAQLRDMGFSSIRRKWKVLQPHMRTALEEMTARIKSVNVVVEMRDARLPFSSCNFAVQEMTGRKPKRIILLNKGDLASVKYRAVR